MASNEIQLIQNNESWGSIKQKLNRTISEVNGFVSNEDENQNSLQEEIDQLPGISINDLSLALVLVVYSPSNEGNCYQITLEELYAYFKRLG